MKKIVHKTDKMKSVEVKFNTPLEVLLRELYVDDNKSLQEMSAILGLHKTLIVNWLVKAGIYSRRLDI